MNFSTAQTKKFVSSDRWHFVFLYETLTHPASTEQFLPQTRRFLAAAAPPICLLLRKLTCLHVQTVLRSNRYARGSPRHLPIVCLQEPASVFGLDAVYPFLNSRMPS